MTINVEAMSASLVYKRNYCYMFTFLGVCEEGSARLTGGLAAREGWVEVCHDETWQSVCDEGWNDVQAEVVCRELGFPSLGQAYYNHSSLCGSNF